MTLWHYTDRVGGEAIVRSGEIRPHPMPLHRDLLLRDEGIITPPIAWLTIDPDVDATIRVRGWGGDDPPPRSLWRFAASPETPLLTLAEWIDTHGPERSAWTWVVRTAVMAGSDPEGWRLSAVPIPMERITAVEELVSARGGRYEWRPAPGHERRAVVTPRQRYLHRATLQTGHVHRTPRGEVSEESIATLRPVLERALAEHRGRIPLADRPTYALSADGHGGCLIATLWTVSDGVPLLTIGVAGNSRCGATHWRMLHQSATAAKTDPHRPPPDPWSAVILHPTVRGHEEVMDWSAPLELALAWTWIEMEK